MAQSEDTNRPESLGEQVDDAEEAIKKSQRERASYTGTPTPPYADADRLAASYGKIAPSKTFCHINLVANAGTSDMPAVSDQVKKVSDLAAELRSIGIDVTVHVDLNWVLDR